MRRSRLPTSYTFKLFRTTTETVDGSQVGKENLVCDCVPCHFSRYRGDVRPGQKAQNERKIDGYILYTGEHRKALSGDILKLYQGDTLIGKFLVEMCQENRSVRGYIDSYNLEIRNLQ